MIQKMNEFITLVSNTKTKVASAEIANGFFGELISSKKMNEAKEAIVGSMETLFSTYSDDTVRVHSLACRILDPGKTAFAELDQEVREIENVTGKGSGGGTSVIPFL